MKPKIILGLLILGLLFTLGGSCPPRKHPCDPATQGGPNMKVEYDYQEGYKLDEFENLYETVNSAFEFVGTEITICRDTFFLPDDPEFFTPDGLLMRERLEQFFYAHKSSGLDYYLASARGLDVNQGAQYKIWGATRPYPQPNVPPNPKWSFVFVGDISEEYYGGRWTKHRTVTYTTIHELGHQRAGLTHPGSFPQYHQATYACIMDTNVTTAVLDNMGFCWSSNSNSADNCRYFLAQQNK